MTTMNAIEITAPGGPEVLQSCTRPRPVPNADQVIIQVAYAGVNRPDALQRAGLYNPPAGASDLPGLEASGTVVEIGENVSDLAVGDRVCALLPGGKPYILWKTNRTSIYLPFPLKKWFR